MVPPIAELARFTVERNGYADRVIVLDKKSVDMSVPADMPRRANLMVTETVDCGLLGEGIIPTVTHARQNLLTADAHIVPCSASVIAMLVESRALFGLNRAHIAAGFDVSPINSYATAGYFPVRLGAFEYKPLTEPFVAFTFDFMADAHTASVRNIDVPVLRSGICHAVVFWFDMQLDEELSLSNRPGSDTHWEQALQCLDGENEVEAGAVLNLEAQHDCTMVSFKLEAR
jgi:type II protein arginine methyltransferase